MYIYFITKHLIEILIIFDICSLDYHMIVYIDSPITCRVKKKSCSNPYTLYNFLAITVTKTQVKQINKNNEGCSSAVLRCAESLSRV